MGSNVDCMTLQMFLLLLFTHHRMQFINITTTFNIIFQHVTMHTQHVQYAVQY